MTARDLHEGVRVAFVGGAFALPGALVGPLVEPASLPSGIEVGGDGVARVADEQDHAAFGQRFHEEQCALGAVGLFYYQVVVGGEEGMGVSGAVKDEVAD